MARYNNYAYLYPPRPEANLPPAMLAQYDKRGWWWQAKMNGTCCVIFTNGKEVIFKSRHNDDHKQWQPLPHHISFFKHKANPGWDVFVGELLHNKTKKIKNKLYLFDVIAHQGEQLIGKTFKQRQTLLEELIPGEVKESEYWYTYNDYIVRARNFAGMPEVALKDEDEAVEGVVMKNPHARLEFCRKGANTGWQIKSRKAHKNYDW
jgi:ATP-dependent DNA ligase